MITCTQTTIACDRKPCKARVKASTRERALSAARRKGWYLGAVQQFCGEHSPKLS